MAFSQSPNTQRYPALNQNPSLDELHQIIRTKAKIYFDCLPSTDKWSDIDLKYGHLWKSAGDPTHPATKARENVRHNVELRRLLQGTMFEKDSLKYISKALDYRINAIHEAQELIASLPSPVPKIVVFDTELHLKTTIFSSGPCEHRQRLLSKAYEYIKRSQLFTPPAIGEGWTFERPALHLALILAEKYDCVEDIIIRIHMWKDLKDLKRLPPHTYLRRYEEMDLIQNDVLPFSEKKTEPDSGVCLDSIPHLGRDDRTIR
jgi:hypothetical protein